MSVSILHTTKVAQPQYGNYFGQKSMSGNQKRVKVKGIFLHLEVSKTLKYLSLYLKDLTEAVKKQQ